MTGAADAPVRVLALWSPDWPVTAAARTAGIPPDRPAAVVVANRVLACSAVARARGVRRGLRRREAQARCPELAVLARDADRDARLFEPVVAAVEELAPGVEVVRPGLVALAAQGPAGYFGGELPAAERLVDRVAARAGVECQVGLADGLFAAVLAARRGVAVEPGRTPAFLAPMGVEELDREPDVDRSELVGLLRRLGLRSLGAFAALDAEDVASRFGADAVLAHRLARGLDPRPPVRRRPPEELSAELVLDPPVDRVDAAAFAARGLAERLHRTLAGHGLSCTRLGIAAHTAAGEELFRVWRCAEPLTPGGTVDRVRWQLDSWLVRGGAGAVVRLRLVPEETVTAGALQLGLWGDVGEADERAGRALVRVQALLGPDAVVTAVLVGGRDPAEQVRLVPWGDDRGGAAGGPRAPLPPEILEAPDAPVGAAGAGLPGGEAATGWAAAPAGWPADVARAAGRTSAPAPSAAPDVGVIKGGASSVDLHEQQSALDRPQPAGGGPAESGPATPPAGTPAAPPAGTPATPPADPSPRSSHRRPLRRSASPRSRPAVHEPAPPWPGRLPAPSPATVPPDPLPAELSDDAGRPVRLAEPDLLSAPPRAVAVDGGPPREVRGWAGPWPLQQRWWAPDGTAGSRVQVVCDGGVALLLLARDGRWWVTGVYD